MSARKYSMNPTDWNIECGCGDVTTYTNRDAYCNAMRRDVYKCRTCSHIGIPLTSEARKNMSEAAKVRKTTKENEAKRRNGITKYQLSRYENMTNDELKELRDNQIDGYKNMCPNMKRSQYDKISKKRIAEMKRNGVVDIFKPSYNVNTIPFIENELSEKYNTKFIHAESPTGEFRIHDSELGKSYYADAYSKELNLWIEIDEAHHFQNGILKESDMIRENRIKEITNGTIVRINIGEI